MPVFFNDWRAQRGRQWNTRQRERRGLQIDSFLHFDTPPPLAASFHTLIVGMPSEEDMPTTKQSYEAMMWEFWREHHCCLQNDPGAN